MIRCSRRRSLQAMNVYRSGFLTIMFALTGWAGDGQTKQDTITRRQAEAMLAELTQIRQLLERTARDAVRSPIPDSPSPALPATRAKLAIEDLNFLGSKDAPLTMIEYSDIQCSFCRRFHDTTFAAIKKNYIDTGKLRFFVRDLPLKFHAYAVPADMASRCAGEQKRFWEMRDLLISNAEKLSEHDIHSHATDLHLDTAEFDSCVKSGRFKAAVEKDVVEAAGFNLNGTPSFVIGRTTPEGVDGATLVGAQPYEAFEVRFKSLETQR
jgi:protein-disulfide isomerase